MITDYRALCTELVHELENTQKSLMYHQGCSVILDSIRCALVDRARAALAEPEHPADGEVAFLAYWLREIARLWESDAPRFKQLARAADLLERLAEPEPVGPTTDELHQLWQELYSFHDGPTSGDVEEIARTVLARWGR